MTAYTPRLIAIVGAESSGKTTLAVELAAQLRGLAVPEFLRQFCDAQQRTPHPHEQRGIMEQQAALEAKAAQAAGAQGKTWVLCDSAPLLTAIYSELLFGDTSLVPWALAHHANYAHTLFLQPDIGWQADGLQRDGAHMQAPVTALLEHYLGGANGRFTRIRGGGTARTQLALAAVLPASVSSVKAAEIPTTF